MRTTLELPDPLFARLKARAASEQISLKQLLQSYVEQGLMAPTHSARPTTRSASQLPKVEGWLAFDSNTTSNADLFDLLEP
ncbi:hypothetical protein [Synechococcus sp. WH 8016]|uniref:hypothetical protein n=1 Tax=Synechococcus sp. WH 8016 TaxID=166318 RepID=UPI00022D9C6C|nr:hypothetical protein [Synechococcus sp. WH 8016]EHA62361.1 hypothetical protein Syn8016DRAFT_1656 [Synechococcus sp. WH 8016]